jgi:hypothetical protein
VAIAILAGGCAALPTSSFLGLGAGSLKGTTEPHFPAPWESEIVLRPMWPKLSAEAIGVHALQHGGDAALVSANELDDAADGRGLQRRGGVCAAASSGGRAAFAILSGMDVVQPQSGTVWLGADCGGIAGLGLPGLERSEAQGSGMVHAQAANAVVGGGSGADFALVDTGRSPSGAVHVDDCEIPGAAWVAGVGSGVGGAGAVVRGRGVAGLFARARESAERGQCGLAAIGADNDDDRLGGNFVEAVPTPK